MTARYLVEIFHTDRDAWVAELERSLRIEVTALGVHHSVEVGVTTGAGMAAAAPARAPAIGVYFGSTSSVGDATLIDRIATAMQSGIPVLPVVESLANFLALVPSVLARLNGWEWSGADPSLRLARKVLEELGIEDRRRRVFISHKREDGLAVAEQLHDHLSHNGFEPFIDRFGVGLAQDVQGEIADALEDCAFLMLIETPLAHLSEWVFDEVEYALSHQMGMHILTWPGEVPELPATNRLPRQRLGRSDLRIEKGYEVLKDGVLDAVLTEVEAIHANAMVRRRRYLLRSAEDAARGAGLDCTPLEGWRLIVGGAGDPSLVQVSARLPTVDDLQTLDQARMQLAGNDPPGVLVHAARMLQPARRAMLAWASGARNLTLIPENAIGGFWS